jgi:hypothetical protein
VKTVKARELVEAKRRKNMKRRMNLQLFEDGAGAGSGNQGGNAGPGNGGQGSAGGASGAHAGTYTYEQLEEIASARVNKSERAADEK